MDGAFPNPENYRELSVPFDSKEEEEQAVEGFMEELYELRRKYKLPNVHVIALSACKDGDGGESNTLYTKFMGSSPYAILMTASAYGAQKKKFVEELKHCLNPD